MKKIVCEMCGGNDFVKTDGFFECQSCGTKYTVEEAKKMMVEGVVEVKGKVSIDHSDLVVNKLKNVISEYKHNNYKVAESLALEILNVDPECEDALIYKGLATGWQSNLKRNQIDTTADEIAKAIRIISKKVDDEEYSKKMIFILNEIKRLGMAIFSLYDEFNEEQQAKVNEFSRLSKEASSKANAESLNALSAAFSSPSVSSSYSSLANTYRNNATKYLQTAQKLDQDRVDTYNGGCILTSTAMALIAKLILTYIKNFSVKSKEKLVLADGFLEAFEGYMEIFEDRLFTDKLVEDHDQIMDVFNGMRIKLSMDYWEEHPEEKAQLDKEIADNKKKIDTLEEEIEKFKNEKVAKLKEKTQKPPSGIKFEKIEEEIEKLKQERSKFGLFDKKNRGPITEKIKELDNKLDELGLKAEQEEKEMLQKANAEIEKLASDIEAKEKLKEIAEKKKRELQRKLYRLD